MKANKNLFISAHVDKETREWMTTHPLNQSQLINYGLYLVKMLENNLKEVKISVTVIKVEPKEKETLPF